MRKSTMPFMRSTFSLVIIAGLLTACGGSSGAGPAPSNAKGQAKAIIRITIPHKTNALSSRRPAYLSSSTQSLGILVAQNGTAVLQEAAGLTVASNPNCAGSGGSTVCTVELDLPAGTYTGTFSTYDGPVVSNAATGNLLSQGQSIPISVTGGQTNTLTITLDGVPASIVVTPAGGSTITGTQSGGFVVPYTAQALLLEALDADGNIIIGAGTPTFSAQATASAYTVTQPTQGTPNQITLAAGNGSTGTLNITAAPPDGGFSCSASGVVCTASASLSPTPPHHLFVLNNSSLSVYTSNDDVTWTLANTNSSGFGGGATPVALATAQNGTVFAAINSFSTPHVSVYAAPYTGIPTSISLNSGPTPAMIGVTSGGTLLVAGGGPLDQFASPWTGTATQTTIGNSFPVEDFTLDSSNNLIVSFRNGFNQTDLYSASSSYGSATSINSSAYGPMALNANQMLALGDFISRNVFIYAPPYTGSPTTFSLPGEGGTETPQALVFDTNGNLWVIGTYSGSCPCNNYLFEFTRPFSSSETPTVAQVYSQGLGFQTMVANSTGDVIIETSTSTLGILNASGATVGTITSGIANPKALLYVK